MIKIYEPYRLNASIEFFTEAINQQDITYQGLHHKIATDKLSNYLNINAILIANGTCATHLLSDALKIERPSVKKLIVPNNVYVAAWNSFLFGKNTFDLIPVDASLETWNYDINKLRAVLNKSDPQEVAVLVVHNIGNVVNVPSLLREYPDFLFVEDNCEGFTGKYEDSFTGTQSLASSISFYANKIITSGEGGAFLTNSLNVYDMIKRIYSQGQSSERYLHDLLAYNYRMTNIQSSLFLSQFSMLEEILDRKNNIWNFYNKNLDFNKFTKQKQEENCQSSKWMYAIRLAGFDYHSELKDKNIGFETRPMFYPMSRHFHLNKYSKFDEQNANILSKECFMIPSHPNLTENDLEFIVNFLNKL